jgi:hypothetical protein
VGFVLEKLPPPFKETLGIVVEDWKTKVGYGLPAVIERVV